MKDGTWNNIVGTVLLATPMHLDDAPMHIAHLIEKNNVGHCDQNLIKVMFIFTRRIMRVYTVALLLPCISAVTPVVTTYLKRTAEFVDTKNFS